MIDMVNNIPRIIWLYWDQGRQNAPSIIKSCINSWEKFNPNWDINILDGETIYNHVDIDKIIGSNKNYLTMPAKSDIIRINLLAKYGGVWVDSSCLCLQSLDNWLHELVGSGFFAFSHFKKDRLISSWFLASLKNGSLTQIYCDAVNAYWRNNVFDGKCRRINKAIEHRLYWKWKMRGYPILKQNSRLPRLSFNPIITKGLRVYPYFWFHYLFTDLLAQEQTVKDVWDQTPKIGIHGCISLQNYGLNKSPSKEVKKAVDERLHPLYKLSWKVPNAVYETGSTLNYTLQSLGLLNN